MNEETPASVGFAEPQRMREPEPEPCRRDPEDRWEVSVTNGGLRQHFSAEGGDVVLEEVVEELKRCNLLDPTKKNTAFQLINVRTSARYRMTDHAHATLRELGVRNGDELQVMYDANVAA